VQEKGLQRRRRKGIRDKDGKRDYKEEQEKGLERRKGKRLKGRMGIRSEKRTGKGIGKTDRKRD
jgi:hypothetical protein